MNNISNLMNQTINQLSDVDLSISPEYKVNLIGDLKNTPRSGKAIRIDKFDLNLPKQSLLDHEYQVARLADFFVEALNLKINEQLLADVIACHDLPEAVIGDIPDFTNNSNLFLRIDNKKDIKEQEKDAIILILNCVSSELKERMTKAFREMDSDSLEAKLFLLSDKIEPIISIWRYIYFYKDKIDIDAFNNAMTDFFDNPSVINNSISDDTATLINFLKNKENAKKYFNSNVIELNNKILTNENIKQVIENYKIESI